VQAPLLVATDVDGTLLDPTDRVTRRTRGALERAAAAGVGLVLVTGRPPRWIPPVVAQAGVVAGLTVCANGAVVYDAATDRIVSARTVDAATLAELAATVAALLPQAGLAVELVHPVPSFVAEPSYRHAWVGSDHEIRPRAELVTRPAVKMLVRDTRMRSEEIVAALAPAVGSAVDLTFSHPGGLVEISAPGVTKALGLAEVAAAAGVAASDVIAFGDMPNDLEMLQWVGHGVAMGNAHPALKDVADEVTATNAEDGLALVLERWF
jgi:Cof subfamily protein (haloacid dehalogenase superfamily)